MQKITPFLWFDYNAEEAVSFYTSFFDDSKILKISRYDEADSICGFEESLKEK